MGIVYDVIKKMSKRKKESPLTDVIEILKKSKTGELKLVPALQTAEAYPPAAAAAAVSRPLIPRSRLPAPSPLYGTRPPSPKRIEFPISISETSTNASAAAARPNIVQQRTFNALQIQQGFSVKDKINNNT